MTITDLGKAIGVKTQEKLLLHGRRLMWRHGYSNVSLRQIAAGAEVDVALVSRYFGGKLGLFQATLDGAFTQADMKFASPQELVDAVVTIFETAPRNVEDPSVLQMMLMNAGDPDVGESVRLRHGETLQAKLEHVIGDRSSAALFMAAAPQNPLIDQYAWREVGAEFDISADAFLTEQGFDERSRALLTET